MHELFSNVLRGNNSMTKSLMLLEDANNSNLDAFSNVSKLFSSVEGKAVLNSNSLNVVVRNAFELMNASNLPITVRQLDVNGNDLMKIGFKGKGIADAQKLILATIWENKLNNNNVDIISFLSK
jgi:hypothetical protein